MYRAEDFQTAGVSVFPIRAGVHVGKGNIVADFPLCNKSFNCSYSGHDL